MMRDSVAALLGCSLLSLNLCHFAVSITVFRKGIVSQYRAKDALSRYTMTAPPPPGETAALFSLPNDLEESIVYKFDTLNGYALSMTIQQLLDINNRLPDVTLKKDETRTAFVNDVELIDEAKLFDPFGRSLSSTRNSLLYNLEQIQIFEAHQITKGAGVKVCIIDSGVAPHDDLDFFKISGAEDSFFPWNKDVVGHGTYLAGIIAAISGNGKGIVGIAPDAEIYVVRVFEESGQDFEYTSDIVQAAFKCVTEGARVINLSLGGKGFQQFEQDGLRQIEKTWGVLFVAAAGNAGPSAPESYPASYDSVLSVAAVDSDSLRWPNSQVNKNVNIAAPGVQIVSTSNIFNKYEARNGTSPACAHVSGVAALLWSYKPDASVAEIKAALLYSAKDLGAEGPDHEFGYGLVQALDALLYLNDGGQPTTAPVSTEVPSQAIASPTEQPPPTVESLRIACDFILESNLTSCQSLLEVYSVASSTIPSELGLLTELSVLDLSMLQLTGSIPSSIGQLTNLRILQLFDNMLTGTLPSSIERLTQLEILVLRINSFTGSIPSLVGELTALRVLDLSSSLFTGTIPASIGSLSELEYLSLGSNSFTSSIPSTFGFLTNLAVLSIPYNELTGRVPSSIGNLTNLDTLLMQSNKLTGEVSSVIEQLLGLIWLDCQSNSLSGTIPFSIGSLTQLKALRLNQNGFTGTIPASVESLESLETMSLEGNKLTGSIPASVGALTNLTSLSLNDNMLNGPIPSSIGSLTQVEVLDLCCNQLSGTIPFSIGSLTGLMTFSVAYNLLEGSIPSSIERLNLCKSLVLNDNQLVGNIPSSIERLIAVEYMNFGENSLSGIIPRSLGTLTTLTTLYLSGNRLSGSIPLSVSELTELESLSLNRNELKGEIPSFLERLTKLTFLDLSFNQFTKTIPSSFEKLSQLEFLAISGNRLTGSIPSSIGKLSQLVTLWLAFNPTLVGMIPSSMVGLGQGHLEDVYLYETGLTGSAPFGLCDDVNQTIWSVDCWSIECPCCVSAMPDLIPCT